MCTQGHSLGGSYASISFAELLRRAAGGGALPAQISLGDIYTFGSPRIGADDFSSTVRDNIKSPTAVGSSWRIANDKDVVTLVPPVLGDPHDYVHVDVGWAIFPDKEPQRLDSEIGTHPEPPKDFSFLNHCESFVVAFLISFIGRGTMLSEQKDILLTRWDLPSA